MADTKISALTAGTAAAGDEVPCNRAGANFKLLVQEIAATPAAASAARDRYDAAVVRVREALAAQAAALSD